jgi:putative endonuclease
MTKQEDGRKNRHWVGKIGEEAAEGHLKDQGYRILYRNFRYGRFGEIDIIAEKAGLLCFVEVKSRSSAHFGLPSEAVTARKRQKIVRVAEYFLSLFHLQDQQARFDVVEVYLDRQEGAPPKAVDVRHIEDAFGDLARY